MNIIKKQSKNKNLIDEVYPVFSFFDPGTAAFCVVWLVLKYPFLGFLLAAGAEE